MFPLRRLACIARRPLTGSLVTLRQPLLLLAVLVLTACQGETKSHGASLEVLSSLEDRTFALVQLDAKDGSMPSAGTLQALNALAQEARQVVLPGCVGQARDALVSVMEEIAQGGPEARTRADLYVNAATACESLLAEQEKRWAAGPG